MTERELKKLGRSDLLEMLLKLSKENDTLRQQLEEANAALRNRTVAVEESGSLAEAALKLNGVFAAAQAACDQYAENIRMRMERQEQLCQQMEAETKKTCERMLAEAKLQADSYKAEAIKQIKEQQGSYAWLYDLIGTTKNDDTQDENL